MKLINKTEIMINNNDRHSFSTTASNLKTELENLTNDIKRGVSINEITISYFIISNCINAGNYSSRKLISFDALNQMTQA